MSANEPSGYGYPTDPQQNPYGQQPPQGRPGHGGTPPQQPYGYPQQPPPPPPQSPYDQAPPPPQSPYDQQAYGAPQQPYGAPQQQYGAPQQPYGAPQQPYGAPPPPPYGGAPQANWPHWLSAPGPYGAVTPGTRTLASAGDRFLARLIDTAVLLIPTLVLYVLLAAQSGILYYLAAGLVNFGYEAAMLLTQGGQTVGKKVMKIRAVDLAQGGRPADGALWTRAAVFSLPLAVYCLGTLFWILNVLWHLWDKPLQQCLHDKAARTLVVKEG
ncbi:RDD family protein [Kitasatospora sp. HPMI-4]|uniref:RDD family protein n=1 Tax=Kitasatospora sp. HPMI-4 TaxID=3448443 RepID=UPI003F193EF5